MSAFFKRFLTEDFVVNNNVSLLKIIIKFSIKSERIWAYNFVV